jgi:kynurenine formamidase
MIALLLSVLYFQVGTDAGPPAGKGKNLDFYGIYSSMFESAKYIDLTHSVIPNTPVWPGFSPSTVSAGKAGQKIDGFVEVGDTFTYEKHGFQTTAYGLVTDQLGTQLDPPAHWNEFGATISDLPATFALRPLVVINVQQKVAKNASYMAEVGDLLQWEKKHARIPRGAVVFFRTDWSKGWESYKASGLPAAFPGVSLAALKFLHLDRRILFHGHEPLDTDSTSNLEGEAWLMHNNFAQAEGVTNLHLVPEYGCLVSIGFARLQGGTGGYARYIAVCPAATPAGVSIASAPGAPLPKQPFPLRRGADGVLVPTQGATPTTYCKSPIALGCEDGHLVQ